MKRYIALLRGVNISGKNQVQMAELRKGFEGLAFENVKTYLNSGNVVFSGDEADIAELTSQIEKMMETLFGLDIPVFVIAAEALADILRNAPAWWGTDSKEIYDNLIFVIPPSKVSDVYTEIGEPKDGLEKAENYREAIFWSFIRKDYQKTNWWSKTASVHISASLTIRTANTVRRIVDL